MTSAPVPRPARRPPLWWTALSLVAAALLVAVGALLVVAGQADDSPGLGGLGLLNALVGLVVGVRAVRARTRSAAG